MSGGDCREAQGPLQSSADEKGPSQFSLLAGNAPAGFPTSQGPASSFQPLSFCYVCAFAISSKNVYTAF